jgi:hypothetical protein
VIAMKKSVNILDRAVQGGRFRSFRPLPYRFQPKNAEEYAAPEE